MKVKWWYFPVGLGGAVVIAAILFVLAVYLYAYANIAAMGFVLKGHKHYDNGEYEEAVKWYDRALKLRPFIAKGHFHHDKGKALAKLGRFEEALELYDEALPYLEKSDIAFIVYEDRADALVGLGRWEEAVEAYREAIEPRLSRSFEDLCDTGTALLESETYEVVVGEPFDIPPTVWDSGKYVEVIAYFKAAAELQPQSSYPYYMEGRAWLALEQYEKAASYFDAASKLAPTYAPAWERKALALGLSGEYEAALECADRALALDADGPDAWNTKGKILLFSGEAAAAREWFDRALAQAPFSSEALLGRGVTYFAEGKYDEARPYFEELVVGAGDYTYYLLYLYLIDRAEGRPGADRLRTLLEAPAGTWAKDASLFLVGRISAEDLLTKAEGDEGMLCEAHFFIGYKNKLDGDAAGARRNFEAAVATGQHDLAEYSLARYELARSGALRAGQTRKGPPGIAGAAATNSLRSVAVITRIVNRRKGDIENVYGEYLSTNPDLEGKLVVRFTVGASGGVTACSVVLSTLGNPAMEREVCDRIATWRFPPVEEGDVTVVYPFVFFSAGAK